ncbi:MAG: hypothetical protein ACC645_18565 [Pirellulales bacterium]
MSARTKQVENILKLLFLLLIVSGIAFSIEYVETKDGIRTEGRIVEKKRKPDGGGPLGDPYEIIIEYEAHDQTSRFSTSRAIWDNLGTLNTIGSTVPVVYLEDGKGHIDRFYYLYPVTATILVVTVIGIAAMIAVCFIHGSRFEMAAARARQYQETKRTPQKNRSYNRRLLIRKLDSLFLFTAFFFLMVFFGFYYRSAWIGILGILGALMVGVSFGRMLKCPHCGKSLAKDLKNITPIIGGRTNWLIVRDYLSKDIPVVCSNCRRPIGCTAIACR